MTAPIFGESEKPWYPDLGSKVLLEAAGRGAHHKRVKIDNPCLASASMHLEKENATKL